MDLNEFRIIVVNDNLLHCAPPGSYINTPFDRASRKEYLRAFELARQTIEVFNSWLSDDKARDRGTMTVIGSHLYALLFPEPFDQAFREVLQQRRKTPNGPPLHVVLEFEAEAAWLAELPWEFLYLQDNPGERTGFFLAAQDDLVLSRKVPFKKAINERESSFDRRPRRILVVLSQPNGQKEVADDLVNAIEKLESSNPESIELRPKVREGSGGAAGCGPTREDFRAWMTDPSFPPDIVHFIGHGRYDRQRDPRLERGQIALVRKEDGEVDWCNEKDFADFFDAKRLPDLVFLHACESGRSNSYRGFKGLALALVRLGVPNVVAMQYPVENIVATRFATSFYRSLLAQFHIDAAVQMGRKELGLGLQDLAKHLRGSGEHFSDRRFGSPMVYVQSWQGLSIFGRENAAVKQLIAAAGNVADDELCPYTAVCKSYHRRDSRFCDQTGYQLRSCISCQRLLKWDAQDCTACGHPQPHTSDSATIAGASDHARVHQNADPDAVNRFRTAAESSPTFGSAPPRVDPWKSGPHSIP